MIAVEELIAERLEVQAARAVCLGHDMETTVLTWEGPRIPGSQSRYVHYARRCRACDARVQVTVDGTVVWEASMGSADLAPCTHLMRPTYEQAYAQALRRLRGQSA
jgi:hypothetical protein